MSGNYDDHGIRFDYPADWEIEVNEDDDGRTTVSLQSSGGLAFAFVTIDEECPSPAEVIAEALGALKAEYPRIDVAEVADTIADRDAIGHDIEFFSLDMTTACATRCFRTAEQTVLIFCQYSELEEDEGDLALRQICRTFEIVETDG